MACTPLSQRLTKWVDPPSCCVFLKQGISKKSPFQCGEASQISKMFSLLMFEAKWLTFETLGDDISLKLTKFQPLKIGQNHPILGL